MKIDMTQALLGLGIFVVAYHLGKRRAVAAPAAAADNTAQTPADWWTYAGGWAVS